MKVPKIFWLAFFTLLLFGAELHAQYGYGGGGYGYGRGRNSRLGTQRSLSPQPTNPEPPKPKTADEIVDEQMPAISETLELNDFEVAVLSTILKKYVQQRIEMSILKLDPEKMREGYEKITENQDKELKESLPLEKYDGFVAMMKSGVQKAKKEKKRKEKKKKRQKKKSES